MPEPDGVHQPEPNPTTVRKVPLAPLPDEPDDRGVFGDPDVEIAVRGEDHPVIAVREEVRARHVVGQLDAGAPGG